MRHVQYPLGVVLCALLLGLLGPGCADEEAVLTYDVPLQEGAPWPKFRRTSDNSGFAPIKPGQGQSQVWSYQTGKGIFSSPVIDKNGTIYIGSADATFYAIGRDGGLVWTKKLGELVDSAALLGSDGTLYFGSGDGHLYAVSSVDGSQRWTFQPKGGAFITWFEGNVAMGPDGTLYAGNDDFHLYAVDRATGKERWSYKVGDQIWSGAALSVARNLLFFGSNDLSLRALDLSLAAQNPADVKKALRWSASTLGSVVGSPLCTPSGRVIFGSFDGYMYGYDGSTGQQVFKLPAREHVYASAARGPDGTIYLPSADGTLYAFSEDGTVKWAYDTQDPIRSSPAVDGEGTIYFGSGDGRLYAINPDGRRRWSFDTSADDRNDLNASPALGTDAVVVAGEDGKVWSIPYDYCLRATDSRCQTAPGEDLPSDGAHLYVLSHGGSSSKSPPASLNVGETLALRLVVREKGETVDAAMDSTNLKITVSPYFKHTIQVSADGSFLVLIPDAALGFSTSYSIRAQGDYLVGGMRLGNMVTGGTKGGSFDQTFDVKTAAQASTASLATTTDEVPVLDLHRLAAPQPTLMPSYNQIGFDFMHLLVGLLEVDTKTGRVLAWVAAGKSSGNDLVVDSGGDKKILFPLSGTFASGSLVLSSASFRVEFAQLDVPMDALRLGATLDDKAQSVGGMSLYASTTCANVEFYAALLKLAGLCNPKTDQLVVHGTALLKRAGQGGKRPVGLTVQTPVLVEATTTIDGSVTVTLGGTLSGKEHLVSILLLDAKTGAPLPLNYSQRTVNTVNSAGKITSASLTFKSTDKVKTGEVEAVVIHDLFPLGRFKL